MNWFHRRSHTPIGIDLDGRCIRAVQLIRSSRGWSVQAAGSVPRQRSNVPVGPEDIDALAKMLRKQGFAGNDVVLAVPAENLVSSIIDLPPRSSGAPVEQIARSELARMHQCDVRAIEIASWALPQPARAANSTPTMVCACTYADADALMKLFARCGYHVVALDTRPKALARACTPILVDPRTITAVIELGWDQAHIVAMHETLVAYDRRLIEAGFEGLVETLVAKTNLDRAAAEELLDEVVLEPQNAYQDGTKRARKPATRVEKHVDMIGDELATALSYLGNLYPDTPVQEVVLTGPCVGIKRLAEYMSARLELDVRVVTPQHLVEMPETLGPPNGEERRSRPRQIASSIDAGAMVAMGLAQYGSDKDGSSVNLIPSPKRLAAQRRRRTRCWVATCAVYILTIAAVYLSCRIRWGGSDLRADEMTRISAEKDGFSRRRTAVKGAVAALRAKIDANNAVGQQPDWSILLALLARNMGSEVVLKHCGLDLDLKGRPVDDSDQTGRRRQFVLEVRGIGRTQTSVSAFVLRLEKAGLFDRVKLIRTSREDFMSGKAVAFQLACTLGAKSRKPK